MTDGRDPRVSRRYRDLGADEPSRELDQAILAAAHRAADRPHAPLVTPAGRHRWYFALGATAILVLAVAVTVQVERQQPDPEALPTPPVPARPDRAEGFVYRQEEVKEGKRAEVEKQVEPRKPLSDAAPAAREARRAPAQPATPAASADNIGARQRAPGETNRMEEAPASAPATAAPAPVPENRDLAAAAEADRRVSAAIQPRQAPRAPAPPSAVSPGVMASAQVNPGELLQRIAELRTQGRHDEADKALAEFRQRYPDYRIPEEMLQKVERKK
jgi:hypothetical protein